MQEASHQSLLLHPEGAGKGEQVASRHAFQRVARYRWRAGADDVKTCPFGHQRPCPTPHTPPLRPPQSLKKATYKAGAFYKGLLLPLCASGTCNLREAVIFTSVIRRTSIPVLHSAAAMLRIAGKEPAGGGQPGGQGVLPLLRSMAAAEAGAA